MNLDKHFKNKYGRRALLKNMSAGAALAPFIPILNADAAAGDKPAQRFIAIVTPNGVEHATPSGNENNYELSDTFKPLEQYKSDITFIKGIDFKSFTSRKIENSHPPVAPQTLTGAYCIQPADGHKNKWTSSRPSIDQFLSKRLMSNPETATRFKSIIAGVETKDWAAKMVHAEPGKPILPETNAGNLHSRIFEGLGNGVAGPDPALLRKFEENKSVLDAVSADLNRVMQKVGRDDRHKISAHLDSIREIESRLILPDADTDNGICSVPDLQKTDGDAEAAYRKKGENMMDIIAHAFACDQTRIATLQWSNGVSKHKFPSKGVIKEHHDLTHNDEKANTGNRVKVSQWYAERMMYLIEKLKSISEGGNTLFDNTTILWTSEHAGGGGHGRTDIPFTFFGSMGGKIQTGKYLDYGRNHKANADGFLTVAHAMGFTDVDTFGEPHLCEGVLPGLLA